MSSSTLIRRGRKAAAATVIAIAAFGLTACQDGRADATKASEGQPAAAASEQSAPESGKSAAGGSSDGGGQNASGTGAANGSGTGKTEAGRGGSGAGSEGSARCTTADMKAGWGSDGGGRPDMNSKDQQTAAVWLSNIGDSACTIQGFPGVQIKANDGRSIDLPRSSQKAAPVMLKPGEHTAFTITLLPSTDDADKKIEPGQVVITPPNEKQHFLLKWPFGGSILDQSGATHPGTFVNPVGGS